MLLKTLKRSLVWSMGSRTLSVKVVITALSLILGILSAASRKPYHKRYNGVAARTFPTLMEVVGSIPHPVYLFYHLVELQPVLHGGGLSGQWWARM